MKLAGIEMKMNMKLPFLCDIRVQPKSLIQKISMLGGVYLLYLILFFFLIFFIIHRGEEFKELERQLEQLNLRMGQVKELQKDRNIFVRDYGEVDPLFLKHVLERMVFLKTEVEPLKLICSHPAFEACDNMKKRLSQLTEGENLFSFSEENRNAEASIEEIELRQHHPVEINASDLKSILSAIEGVSMGEAKPPNGRPQFIVRHCNLKKKKLAERETYLLEMQLIKRGLIK